MFFRDISIKYFKIFLKNISPQFWNIVKTLRSISRHWNLLKYNKLKLWLVLFCKNVILDFPITLKLIPPTSNCFSILCLQTGLNIHKLSCKYTYPSSRNRCSIKIETPKNILLGLHIWGHLSPANVLNTLF